MVEFWAWVGHSDNATHFKSGKMFHYWSTLSRDIEFVKMVWINFGCPGHGKGAWDGFGAVVKTKVPAPAAPRPARGPSLNTHALSQKGNTQHLPKLTDCCDGAVARQIRTTLIKGKEGARTSSGKVSDYREAAQLAESYFCTPEYEAKH
eukprot:3833264-Prymnesium_polylepis.1